MSREEPMCVRLGGCGMSGEALCPTDGLDKCYAKQATAAEKKHDWERNTSADIICVLNKPLA